MLTKKFHVLLFAIIIIVASTHAQQHAAKIICSPRQDSILLRWAPTNSETWRLGNQHGYTIERVTILVNKKVPKEIATQKLTETPLKPAPIETWEKHADDKYPAIAAECIFSKAAETPIAANPHIAYKKHKNEQQKYSFALYAADQSVLAAKLSGLYFADKTAKANEKYLYRVYLNLPDSIRQDTATAVSGVSEYQPLPKPYNLVAEWEDKSVSLSWDIRFLKHVYNSYRVEKSIDGGLTYGQISDNATIQLADKGVNPRRMYKSDSLKENGKTYFYRVRGISAFGETGPPSDSVFGTGQKPLSEAPVFTENTVMGNTRVKLEWSYPKEMNPFIDGFRIYRSKSPEGKKSIVLNGGNAEQRTFMDTTPSITNYYNIAVVAGTKEKLSPILSHAQLVDSVPPHAPAIIASMVDSTGLVTLNWKKNTDEDIDGYRVYSANNPNNEFILQTPSVLHDTLYNQKINIKTLTEKIYYKVRAIDMMGNQSDLSELITVTRPDIIPPVPPLMQSVVIEDKNTVISWINSPSSDVTKHHIYKKESSEPTFKSIASVAMEAKDKASFTDKNTTGGRTYVYYIVAEDDNGLISAPSKRMAIKTPGVSTEAIKLKRKSYIDRTKLSWTVKSKKEVERYLIYRSVNEGAIRLYSNSTGEEFIDEKLSPGKIYHYQVKAVYKDGSMSVLSNAVKVKM